MPGKRFALALLITLFSSAILANNDDGFFGKPGPKPERSYISFGASMNEFNKVRFSLVQSNSVNEEFQAEGPSVLSFRGLTAQSYGLSMIYGNYLDDNYRTEFRYGRGIKEDILKEAKGLNLDYWMSMLIGADRDITDYLRAYAMFGVSYYQSKISHRETFRRYSEGAEGALQAENLLRPSEYSDPEGLFETNFSITWLLGFDYKLSDQWYLSFEYGRLLKDTNTDVEIDQYNTYLKFEF
jgi:opacity protein-like surface antigen